MSRYRTTGSKATAAAAMGTLVLVTGAACGEDAPDNEVYCVDRFTNQVVACDIEDRDPEGGSFFYYYGSAGHSHGYVVPANQRGSYFARNDTAKRSQYGLSSDPKSKIGGTKFSSGGGGKGSTGNSGKSGSGS
jgi:hypothetical protein